MGVNKTKVYYSEMKKGEIHLTNYFSFLCNMVTFFVIATKKVMKRNPERKRRISSWSSLRFMRCFACAQHDALGGICVKYQTLK
jgi:hypothetical protein